jgi:hypothetical protein
MRFLLKNDKKKEKALGKQSVLKANSTKILF